MRSTKHARAFYSNVSHSLLFVHVFFLFFFFFCQGPSGIGNHQTARKGRGRCAIFCEAPLNLRRSRKKVSNSSRNEEARCAPSLGGGGSTHAMHGRSRMTIDPCIATSPGRSSLGFHRPGKRCLHQAQSVVRCWYEG